MLKKQNSIGMLLRRIYAQDGIFIQLTIMKALQFAMAAKNAVILLIYRRKDIIGVKLITRLTEKMAPL